jgi:replicative DNA helicase
MFLYRPDEENRSDIKLLIAKHRNGPTGELDMYFRGERTKFYEAETVRGG